MIKDYTILSFSFENYQHFTANPTVFDKDMVTEANPWQIQKVSFKQQGATNLRWVWRQLLDFLQIIHSRGGLHKGGESLL